MKLPRSGYGRLARHARGLRSGALVALVVLTATVATLYIVPQDRSFRIDVETLGAEVTSDGAQRASWRLDGVVICRRHGRSLRGSSEEKERSEAHEECDPRAYVVARYDEALEFVWPEESRYRLLAGRAGELVIDIIALKPEQAELFGPSVEKIARGSRLILSREAFEDSGSLPFSGRVTVGAIPDGGERGILHKGTYSIRETLPLRSRPIAVSSGEIEAGDRVTFQPGDLTTDQQGKDSNTVFGFVSSNPGEGSLLPFRLVAYTELGRGQMIIDRYSSRSVEVSPSWAERAIRDPLLLGLTALLTFSALCISILADAISFLGGRGEEGRPAGADDEAQRVNAKKPELPAAPPDHVEESEERPDPLPP